MLRFKVETMSRDMLVDTVSFEVGLKPWNTLVSEWNSMVHDQKDPNDLLVCNTLLCTPLPLTPLPLSQPQEVSERRGARSTSSKDSRIEHVCVCEHHSPVRPRNSLGSAMAAVFQAQRRLHYSLLNRDAFTTETSVEELDTLNAFDRVVDLLEHCFPRVARSDLHTHYQNYIQQILDDPLSRGRPGEKVSLPPTWPPPTRSLF